MECEKKMAMHDRQNESYEGEQLDIPTPLGAFRSKNYRAMDLIAMGVVVALVVAPFIAFKYHREEVQSLNDYWTKHTQSQSEVHYKQLSAVLQSIREISFATKYQTCINAIPEKQRWDELRQGANGTCYNLARQGFPP